MIGPFLGVTLVPQPEVRNIMIPIFHDMMDWEQRKNGNFKQVRSLVTDAAGPETHFGISGELFYPCLHCCISAALGPLPTFALLEAQSAYTYTCEGTSLVINRPYFPWEACGQLIDSKLETRQALNWE